MAAAGGAAAGAVTTSAGLGSAAFSVGVSAVFVELVLGSRHLRRIRHRRGGVQFEIAGGRGRDVGGFGTRDRRVDREFRGAAAGRIGLRQCRGRGHREEGRRDSHQHAVISSTVRRTVTHRHTPWAKLPRHGTVLDGFGTAVAPYSFAKAPALLFGSNIQQRHWFASERVPDLSRVATPARNDSYADGTCAPLMRPAPRGATHDKLTSKHPICNGLCAFATLFAVCLSPPSNGSNVPERLMSTAFALRTPHRHNPTRVQLASSAPPDAGSSAAASSSLR